MLALAQGCAGWPLRSHPGSQRAALSLYLRGLMLERSSSLPDALDAYEQAAAHDASSPFLHVRIGATQVRLGKPDQALKSFQRALAADPENHEAWRWIAMLHTSQGNLDAAIRAYQRLAEQQPSDQFLLSTLADLYVLQGDLTQAASLYEQLVRQDDASAQLHFNLGVLYGRLNQFASAVQELSRAVALSPDSSDMRVALGLTYEINHQPNDAVQQYEEAIRLDPLNPRVYHHAARVYAAQDRWPDAVADYQAILDLAPKDLEAVNGLVQAWIAQRKFGEAQGLLAQQLAISDRQTELYILLGVLYQEAKAPLEAVRAFEQAIALRETAVAQFYCGAQLAQLGRPVDARAALERAIELDPSHADALNYLGYLDIDDGVNLQQAKGLVERALAIDPDNGAYVDSLGWAHFKLGNLPEAIRQLERAAQLLQTDPTIFVHLGEAYAKRGDAARAQQAWEKALGMDATLDVVRYKLDTLTDRRAREVKVP